MKNQIIKLSIAMVAVLTFTQIKAEEPGSFYCNPLILNTKPLDYQSFTIQSRGLLAMVEGNPNDAKAVRIPFRAYLMRNGQVIFSGHSQMLREVLEVNLSAILAFALAGDELIIEPSRKADNKAKRSIFLKEPPFFQTYLGLLRRRDGC